MTTAQDCSCKVCECDKSDARFDCAMCHKYCEHCCEQRKLKRIEDISIDDIEVIVQELESDDIIENDDGSVTIKLR